MAAPFAPSGGPMRSRVYVEGILMGSTIGSLVASYLRFSVPPVYWIAAMVAAIIGMFLTMLALQMPVVRLILLLLLGTTLGALASTALFIGRVF
jgi:hypothetical protein